MKSRGKGREDWRRGCTCTCTCTCTCERTMENERWKCMWDKGGRIGEKGVLVHVHVLVKGE